MASEQDASIGVEQVSTEKPERLRSERTANPKRTRRATSTLMARRARVVKDRQALVAHFREWLERSLTVDGSFEQSQLITVAVSASLEISVLSERFEHCRAKSHERDRLGRARSELVRALRALGLPKIKTLGADPHASIDAIRRSYAAKSKTPEVHV